MTTSIVNCSIVQLVAIDRAVRGKYNVELLKGETPWGGTKTRQRAQQALLERLRDVRGLNIIEDHSGPQMTVTIAGTVRPDGFTKKL